jgi:imidazolonepropionase-like amidohydrolase
VPIDIWLSTQPFAEHDPTFGQPGQCGKNRPVCAGTDRLYQWARQYGVKGWGTDLLFEPEAGGRQSEMMTRLGDYFTNVDALKIVTSGNASLFRLAGERDPHRAARLGEVTVGAWADVLLIDGDPTTDLTLLAEPANNIAVIVKDGTVVKSTL